MALPEGIELNPKVMLGKLAIRGTPIPVELILRKLAEGATEQDLLDACPNLKVGDIRAAMTYAAARSPTKRLCSVSTRLRCCDFSPTRAATSPLFARCGLTASTFYRLLRLRRARTPSG